MGEETDISLESKIELFSSVALCIVSIFFMSLSITGKAISNLTVTGSKIIGESLFLAGLVLALVYFRRK